MTDLRQIIGSGKDTLDPFSHCGVVYKISCCDCNATYIGQTKKQLNKKTKVKEQGKE